MNSHRQSLQECTRDTIHQYLNNMKGHQAQNLHAYIMDEIEKGLIREVLQFTAGHLSQSSKILGITRTTLRNKIRKHQLLD